MREVRYRLWACRFWGQMMGLNRGFASYMGIYGGFTAERGRALNLLPK